MEQYVHPKAVGCGTAEGSEMRSRSSSTRPSLRNPLSGWQTAPEAGPDHSSSKGTAPRHLQEMRGPHTGMAPTVQQGRDVSEAWNGFDGSAASPQLQEQLESEQASLVSRSKTAEFMYSQGHPSGEFNNSNGAVHAPDSSSLRMEELGKWRTKREAELRKLLVKQHLQPLCKKYNIPYYGKKEQLIERLLNHEAIRSRW